MIGDAHAMPRAAGGRTGFAHRILPLMALASVVVIAALFAWAGLAKLADPGAFAAALRSLLPGVQADALWWLAHAVSRMELVLAVVVLLPWTRGGGLVGIIAVLMAFSVALIVGAWRAAGVESPCACFGGALDGGLIGNLVRNVVLMAMAGFALWWWWRGHDRCRS